MRLLLCTQCFTPELGGVQRYTRELADALVRCGADVRVLAPAQAGAREHDASLSYPVVRYLARPARELGLAAEVLRQGALPAPDAVVCLQWSSLPMSLGLHYVQRHAPVLVVIAHGNELMPPSTARGRIISRLRALCLSRASHVFAVSRYSAQCAQAAGARASAVTVLCPGVDTVRFQPPSPDERARFRDPAFGLQLVTLARLVPRKGIDRVIAALPELVSRYPGLRYLIAGDGTDRARLEALAARLGVAAHVRFLGVVDERALPALYGAADVFVLPSRTIAAAGEVEGFGLVLLEAQACGAVVMATRAGGIPDALVAGVTGELLEDDRPATLVTALDALLGDPARRARMSEAAVAYARDQAWERVAARLIAALQRW